MFLLVVFFAVFRCDMVVLGGFLMVLKVVFKSFHFQETRRDLSLKASYHQNSSNTFFFLVKRSM